MIHARQIAEVLPRMGYSRRWAGAVCTLVLCPMSAYPLTWEYVPSVSSGISYQTNPGYDESNLEDDAYAAVLDASLTLAGESQRTRFTLRPSVNAGVYAGSKQDSGLNRIDYVLPFSATRSNTRSQYGVNGRYSKVSTTESEFFVVDPNSPGPPGSSGHLVSVDENQERWNLAPFATYLVTQKDQLSLHANFEDISYDQAAITGRSNYQYGSAGASLTHSLNLRHRISVSVDLSGFNADQPSTNVENETFTYGMDAGYEYSLSSVTSMGFTGGASWSDISVTGLSVIDADNNPNTPPLSCFDPQLGIVPCEIKTNDTNFIGQLFFRQRSDQRITTEFSISRSLQPNSDGAQITQDYARAYVAKQFTQRLSGSIGLSYSRQDVVGKETAGSLAQRFNRDYTQADLGLGWRLARTWWLRANYAFTRSEEVDIASTTVQNHIVTLQVQYQGLGSH